MERTITLRFPGKCSVCQNTIPAGERAIWRGKKMPMSHVHCSPAPVTNAPVTVSSAREHTVSFESVRDLFREISSGNFRGIGRKQHKVAESILGYWKNDSEWTGATISEMKTWLSEGYHVEGLQGIDGSLISAKPKRKMIYGEDGDELQIDLAWSGSDTPFSDWEKRIRKPGLEVEIDLCYSALNSYSVIRPYVIWVARMLHTLDENAVDVGVSIVNRTTNLTREESYAETNTRVRVKNVGEAADFATWSAMVSPGGFRQLVFTAKLPTADHFGETVSSGLGSPVNFPAYDLQYDPDANVLRVKQPNGGDFPEFEMTQKLQAVIDTISGTT